jgi:hypothetical protein
LIDCSFFEQSKNSRIQLVLDVSTTAYALNQSAYMSVVLHEQKIFTLAVTALVLNLILSFGLHYFHVEGMIAALL